MDYAAADLQGSIGYMFQRALRNEFRRRGLQRSAIAVVTQVLVDRNDPAFAEPAKPIGSQMDEERARRLAAELGWIVRDDAGRGWRRVVPSPLPQGIVEIDEIEHLVSAGYVVIACGGGGIPVFQGEDGDLQGVEAVIDKDLSSALIAEEVGADVLLLLTDVPAVWTRWPMAQGQPIRRITPQVLRAMPFDPGSMGPKVEAACRFAERTGRVAAIGAVDQAEAILAAEAGTIVAMTR